MFVAEDFLIVLHGGCVVPKDRGNDAREQQWLQVEGLGCCGLFVYVTEVFAAEYAMQR